MPEHRECRPRREQRPRAQRKVEGDHVAVREAQRLFERHGADPTTFPPACCKPAAHGRETGGGGETTRREQDGDQVTARRRGAQTTSRRDGASTRKPAKKDVKTLSAFITERFDEFSRSQKDVARYIVDHLDEAAFQTAEELARRANTSSSTVVRFSQALGFEGYPELQQAAIEEYRSNPAIAGGDTASLFDFDHSEFEASLAADHGDLEDTVRNLTSEQVEACVTALAGATRVMIVGMDQLAFFASYLRHLLALLDIRAEVVASPRQDSITRLSRLEEGALVIGFSAGRAHPILVRAMKLAKHRQATTLAITDASLSEVGEHADLTLYFSSNSPSFIQSNTSLLALVQALAYGVYSRDKGAYKDRIRAFKLK